MTLEQALADIEKLARGGIARARVRAPIYAVAGGRKS